MRSVRNYCAEGRVPGAVLMGKVWMIPEGAEKPIRKTRSDAAPETLLDILHREKNTSLSGGIYHKLQIELTYNSNHMEGSRLTHDQTRYIFETNTIGATNDSVNVDDIVETSNHFRCIDLLIENATSILTEGFIKELHRVLKNGTSDSRQSWFAVGDYKKLPNEVGGKDTTLPENVAAEMKSLMSSYNAKKEKTFEEILDFHYRFERIHPFQDGNGRVGRLIMFKECLRHNVMPFILDDKRRARYLEGIRNWEGDHGILVEVVMEAQSRFDAQIQLQMLAEHRQSFQMIGFMEDEL